MGFILAFFDGFFVTDKSDVIVLLRIDLGLVLLCALLTCLYFPDKPPTPPSASTDISDEQEQDGNQTETLIGSQSNENQHRSRTTKRPGFLNGMRLLKDNSKFLFLLFGCGSMYGVAMGWSSVMATTLIPLGFSQYDVAICGILTGTIAVLLGFVLSRWLDRNPGRLKRTIFITTSFAVASFWTFCLVSTATSVNQDHPASRGFVQFGFICIGGTLASVNAVVPFMFELGVELTYPVNEIMSASLINCLQNLVSLLILLTLSIWDIPPVVVLWSIALLLFLGNLPFPCWTEEYRRRTKDASASKLADSEDRESL